MNVFVYGNTYTSEQAEGMGEVPLGDWRVDQVLSGQREWLVFAYGSAMDTNRFQESGVDGFFEDIVGTGVLRGYDLKFTRRAPDGGRADVMEVGGCVEGKVYRVGTVALEYLLDREGVSGKIYRPTLVDVTVDDALFQDVLVFVTVEKEAEMCPPAWYAKEILRGASGWVSDEYMHVFRAKLEATRR